MVYNIFKNYIKEETIMRVWKKVPGLDCLASDDGKIRQINSPIKRIQEEFERPQFYYKTYYYNSFF